MNNSRLMTAFAPQRFHGDVMLFVATRKTKPSRRSRSGGSYVGGEIKMHPIDCRT